MTVFEDVDCGSQRNATTCFVRFRTRHRALIALGHLRVVAYDVTSLPNSNRTWLGGFAVIDRNQQAAIDIARLYLVGVGTLG
jgi:hypothetical protein